MTLTTGYFRAGYEQGRAIFVGVVRSGYGHLVLWCHDHHHGPGTGATVEAQACIERRMAKLLQAARTEGQRWR